MLRVSRYDFVVVLNLLIEVIFLMNGGMNEFLTNTVCILTNTLHSAMRQVTTSRCILALKLRLYVAFFSRWIET